GHALTKAEEGRLIFINGDQFGPLLGTELKRYALLSVSREGRLRAVPMQFLERTPDGLPYFVTDTAVSAPGNALLLDASDQLVFQLEDTGPRFQGRSPQKMYAEIEVTT